MDEPAPSAPDSVPGASTSQAPDHSAGPLVQMRVTPGELSVVLAGGPRDDFAPVQAQALDSVARVLGTDPGRRAAVRYTDPAFTHDSPSWEAARRVSDYLMLRGVAGERVALVRVALVRAAFAPASGGRAAGGRAATDAVEVVVPSRAGRE